MKRHPYSGAKKRPLVVVKTADSFDQGRPVARCSWNDGGAVCGQPADRLIHWPPYNQKIERHYRDLTDEEMTAQAEGRPARGFGDEAPVR